MHCRGSDWNGEEGLRLESTANCSPVFVSSHTCLTTDDVSHRVAIVTVVMATMRVR